MSYIDGFLLAVPTANRGAYTAKAEGMVPFFKDHGALKVVECWGDDVPDGEQTSFPMAVKAEPGETVVFAWVAWPSKDARNAGMKAMQEDPRFKAMDMSGMPFDAKRMMFGGFEVIVDA